MEAKIKRLCTNHQREPFWSHCSDLFNESTYGSNDLQSQIKNIVVYILSPTFPEIQKRVKLHQRFTEFENTVFLKPEWTLFKPQRKNKLNISLHDYLENMGNEANLKRRSGGYLIENISVVRPIVDAGNDSLAKLCKIPTLEIVQNIAFQKLFRYAVSCYGVHPNHVSITILIYQMLEEATKSESIKSILKQNGWSETSGGFKNLDFGVWRKSIIPNILSLYGAEGSSLIKSCYSNEGSCNSFIHRLVNNYDLPILNTLPKRIYSYVTPTVFPDISFSRLAEGRPEFIQKLFGRYRINSVGDIVTYAGNEDYCDKFSLQSFQSLQGRDHLVTRSTMKTLSQTADNFDGLLETKRAKHSLPYVPKINTKVTYTKEDYEFTDESKSTENRVLEWLNIRGGVISTLDTEIQTLLENHHLDKSVTKESWTRLYKDTFSQCVMVQSDHINRVSTFLMHSDAIGKDRRDRFASIFRSKFTSENIQKIMTIFMKDLSYNLVIQYSQDIQSILNLVSAVSLDSNSPSERQLSSGGKMIPKEWKLSEGNKDHLSRFLVRELLNESRTKVPFSYFLHNKQLDPKLKDPFSGFYSYQLEDGDSHIYLGGLKEFIKPELTKLYLLKGNSQGIYSEKLSETYLRYHFIMILSMMCSYIEGLQDSQSDIVRDANMLFVSLDQSAEEGIQRSIDVCSQFMMDLLTHLLMTHYDPSWIYMNRGEELDKRLSKQKEREKGERIKQLDNASGTQEREIMKAKQDAGLTNWYKEASEAAAKFVNSDEWRNSGESERNDKLKEIFESLGLDPEEAASGNMNLQGIIRAVDDNPDDPEIGYNHVDEIEQDDDDDPDNPEENLNEEFDEEFNE